MRVDQLDYDLPGDLIATTPARPRDAARLMVIDRADGRVHHHQVRDLPALGVLQEGDLMVVNQTRVLPAYLRGRRESTGGQITGLFLAEASPAKDGHADLTRWLVMLESRGRLRAGEWIVLEQADAEQTTAATLTLVEPHGPGQWLATVHSGLSTLDLLNRVGATPLPPYIRKARRQMHLPEIQDEDALHYNTVFASDPGSVAAPTAGLHLTPSLLEQLQAGGIDKAPLTLHVGLGTFAPIRSNELGDHAMHEEWLRIPATTIHAIRNAQAHGRRVVAIGTTSVRALESLPLNRLRGQAAGTDDKGPSDDYIAHTSLFIHPDSGHTWRCTDALLTNFHLPRSTLLALVAALPGVGIDRLRQWYQIAIDEKYRFYSYGDAMLIL